MAVRAVLTFAVTIAFIRLGANRLSGKGTAFDYIVIVAIMIGSVMIALLGHHRQARGWLIHLRVGEVLTALTGLR